MPGALENARRANVQQRWPRLGWDELGRSRWEAWSWTHYLFIEIFCLLLSATFLYTALANNGRTQSFWPIGFLTESPAGLSVIMFLMVLNGWLLDRGLADRTSGENTLPRWLRWLRRTLVSVPVLGLYGIPLWRWILETHPDWAFPASGPLKIDLQSSQSLSLHCSHFRARINAFRRTKGQSLIALSLLMIAGQIVPWLALLSWPTTADIQESNRRIVLTGLTVLCHVLACVSAVQYVVIRGRKIHIGRWKAIVLRCAPLLLLAPFPSFLVGLLLLMLLSGEEEQTLMNWSRSNRHRPSRPIALEVGSPVGHLIRLLIRSKRELDVVLNDLLPGALKSGVLKSQQAAFYRLKTFLLLFDAAALAWAFTRLVDRLILPMEVFPWHQLAPFFCLAALGALVELSFLALHVSSWFLRRGLPYQPYGRSITVTQLALIAGLLFGNLLITGQAPVAGHLLVLIGLAGAIGSTLIFAPISFLLMLPGRQTLLIGVWAVLFFELFLTGAVMHYQPEFAPPFVSFFKIAMALTPIWSITLFFSLRGWLLHPFKLEHLFERRLPGKARSALAAVVLTAVLPLGGIAIPFWIYAHHRLWPRYENSLWDLKRTSTSIP